MGVKGGQLLSRTRELGGRGDAAAVEAATGVVVPEVGGRRSSSAMGRAIVADALRAVDPIGAAAAEREANWRHGYGTHFRRLVEAGLPDPGLAVAIAAAGLESVQRRLHWAGEARAATPLAELDFLRSGHGRFVTEELRGAQPDPERVLSVPYRGRRLAGDDLRRQLDAWVGAGVVEPSVRESLGALMDAGSDALDLSDRIFVVLGAASEMGPMHSLLRWGATVAALDLPRPRVWQRLLTEAHELPGRVLLPALEGGCERLPHRAGIDLVHDLGAAVDWVSSLPGRLVIGNYVYADGPANVRVSAAVDALTGAVRRTRPPADVALAFLATPTDVFAVPADAVAASVAAYAGRGISRVLQVPLHTMSCGRLLRRGYLPGQDPGINDSVVVQQGPNYLLAKRLQRWRATTARAEGAVVSLNVAPPTRTRSVVKNRALAAAYAGAHRFGMEIFEPGTSNTLMAALLVQDLRTGAPTLGHPWQDEAQNAVHGGLWRSAYDPRSALGLAALLGTVLAR